MPGLKTNPKVEALLPTMVQSLGDYGLDLVWSPQGDRFVGAPATGFFRAVEAGSGQFLANLPGHEGGNLGLAWSPDGTRLATSGQDGSVRLYDGATFAPVAQAKVGTSWVEHLAFSPDSRSLAVAAGKSVKLLNMNGTLQEEFEPSPYTVSGLSWRTDSKGVWASAYGGVSLFNSGKPKPAKYLKWKGSLVSLRLSPDARHLAAGCQDGAVHVWITATGKDMEMSGYPIKVKELSWSSDSRYLATGGGNEPILWDFSGKGPQGSKPIVLEPHAQPLADAAFHPSENIVAVGDQSGIVTVWSIQGKKAVPLAAAARLSAVSRLAWAPTGRMLASVHASGELCVWYPLGMK